jgi:putative FmdB family regulatory protein
MPNYEYICHECETIFNKTMAFTEYDKQPVLIECPHCHKRKAKRIITRPPIVKYIGDGFFTTDNKGKDEQ